MSKAAPGQEVPDSEPVSERSYGIIPIRPILNPISTVGKLSTSTTEVLLIKQKSFVPGHPPFWSFPKGHSEQSDKSAIDTAIRELREETGIIVKEDRILFRNDEPLIERYRNQLRGWVKEVRYWVGLVDSESEGEGEGEGKLEIQLAELVDATWLSWEVALETLSFKNGKELLCRVMDLLDREDDEENMEKRLFLGKI